MKHLFLILFLAVLSLSVKAQSLTGETLPTTALPSQTPYNATFYIDPADTTEIVRNGSRGFIKLARAAKVRWQLDSIAHYGWKQVKDTLDFYVLKTTEINGFDLSGNVTLATININPSTDRNYTTDYEKIVLGNTSGVNTGDQDLSGKQDDLNGTGFVKATGTVISYDNSTYEPAFSKNTGFNKDIGTTSGTVLEGRTFGTAANSASTDFQPIITGLTTNYHTKWNGTSIVNSLVSDNGTNVGFGINNPYEIPPSGFIGKGFEMFNPSGDIGISGRTYASGYGFDIWSRYEDAITFFDSRYNSDNGDIYFRTKTSGSPINALILKGNGSAIFGSSVTVNSPTGAYIFGLKGSGTGERDYRFWINTSGDLILDDFTGLASRFAVKATGEINILSTTPSTSSTTGALTVVGGLGVGGNVTASAFVKSGGTSAQYLLADGSVTTSSGAVYKGEINGSTGSGLADGTGTAGWYYACSTTGTHNYGSGNITLSVGDQLYYNGTVWLKIPGAGSYTLPVATASLLGGVKSSASFSIAGDGTASVSTAYEPSGAIATHAALTTTAHGLGASAFHADNYFEAPLTFSTGLNRTGNTITNTITQYTDALARNAVSFTAGTGAYNSTTGVITIPTNTTHLTNGSGYMSPWYLAVNGVGSSAIGSGTGVNIVQGTNVSISRSGNDITINMPTTIPTNTNQLTNGAGFTTNTGTVTSVGLSVPTGLSITSGSPVTSSGTIAVGLQSGYVIPTTTNISHAETAYTDRFKFYVGGTQAGQMNSQHFEVVGGDAKIRYASLLSNEYYNPPTAASVADALATKQATLVSGTNIKTVNGNSLLGSGNLSLTASAAWGSITGTLSSQTDLQTALNAKAQLAGSLSQAFSTSVLTVEAGTYDWTISQSSGALAFSQYGTTISMSSSGVSAPGATLTGALTGTSATFTGALNCAEGYRGYSDERLKEHIESIKIKASRIKLRQFEMIKDSTNRLHYGASAQEVEKTNPELVYTDDKGMKSVAYIELLVLKVAQLEEDMKANKQGGNGIPSWVWAFGGLLIFMNISLLLKLRRK